MLQFLHIDYDDNVVVADDDNPGTMTPQHKITFTCQYT